MRVKFRVLAVAALTAAFFGTVPAFASDDAPEAPAPVSESEFPTETGADEQDGPGQSEEPEPDDPAEAGPVTPIEEEPAYTG
ncbi:hypothetical protein ABZ635_25150 [Nocardiopsis sp. NPDC007018]|uniref:hypothetical protein n=1 Tax=Nocardiopsis sp. NPDC007018 TaxID=3155721 RepID=UPI0033F9690C